MGDTLWRQIVELLFFSSQSNAIRRAITHVRLRNGSVSIVSLRLHACIELFAKKYEVQDGVDNIVYVGRDDCRRHVDYDTRDSNHKASANVLVDSVLITVLFYKTPF